MTTEPFTATCPECRETAHQVLAPSTCQALYQCQSCWYIFALPVEPASDRRRIPDVAADPAPIRFGMRR